MPVAAPIALLILDGSVIPRLSIPMDSSPGFLEPNNPPPNDCIPYLISLAPDLISLADNLRINPEIPINTFNPLPNIFVTGLNINAAYLAIPPNIEPINDLFFLDTFPSADGSTFSIAEPGEFFIIIGIKYLDILALTRLL